MKTYTINNVSVSEEDLKKIIKENPSLLETKKQGRYFKPKDGEKYYYLAWNGDVWDGKHRDSAGDRNLIARGNCYRTKEDAELALAKEQALIRLWDWAEEHTPFEPDWSDEGQDKFDVSYDYDDKCFYSYESDVVKYQFTLPYFATEKDCNKFISANLEDLQLLWGVN